MRQFGADLEFPRFARSGRVRSVRAGGLRVRRTRGPRAVREARRRVRVRRAKREIWIYEDEMLPSDELIGLKPGKQRVSPESLLLPRGVQCPSVLGAMGWGGMDGLAVSQAEAAGAVLPSPGGMTFSLLRENQIMQIRSRYAGAYEGRSCTLTVVPAEAREVVALLQGSTRARLREWGLVQ